MSLKYFGTDGIRGEYGGSLLNDSLAYRAGRAAAVLAKRLYSVGKPVLLVGRDTRASGVALQGALTSGFVIEGGEVVHVGVAPTPAIAFACDRSRSHIGCAITASHNPFGDNGLKFFDASGSKLNEETEALFDSLLDEFEVPVSFEKSGNAEDASDLIEGYCAELGKRFGGGILKGKRVALDCANGATSGIAGALFESLGAQVDVIGDEPDGTNINKGVGSECPGAIGSLYSKASYDLGFAFDGDGDRVIAFDERGQKLSGEGILAALAIWMKGRGKLSGDTLVTTRQSNLGLDVALTEYGISVEREDIGDKHVSRKMRAGGFDLGGEESGHVIIGAFAMTGDGICSALTACEMAATSDKSLSELAAPYQAFPQLSQGIKVEEKIPLEKCSRLQAVMAELEISLGDEGRMLIRYSGTEPKLRLLVEAKSDDQVRSAMDSLLAAASEDLTVL